VALEGLAAVERDALTPEEYQNPASPSDQRFSRMQLAGLNEGQWSVLIADVMPTRRHTTAQHA
jgi:hypothetical protein